MAEDDAQLRESDDDGTPRELVAGVACASLLTDPRSWIRRRVETIDMLAHEEAHRRVSIDFALPPEQYAALTIDDGVVVPISVLTKERRRNIRITIGTVPTGIVLAGGGDSFATLLAANGVSYLVAAAVVATLPRRRTERASPVRRRLLLPSAPTTA